jgi:hypothetical protein
MLLNWKQMPSTNIAFRERQLIELNSQRMQKNRIISIANAIQKKSMKVTDLIGSFQRSQKSHLIAMKNVKILLIRCASIMNSISVKGIKLLCNQRNGTDKKSPDFGE